MHATSSKAACHIPTPQSKCGPNEMRE